MSWHVKFAINIREAVCINRIISHVGAAVFRQTVGCNELRKRRLFSTILTIGQIASAKVSGDEELEKRCTSDERVRFPRASAKLERRLMPKAGQRRELERKRTKREREREREYWNTDQEYVRALDVRPDFRR